MVVLSQIVIMELNEGLDCFLDWAHLDQSHLAIFSVKYKKYNVMSECFLYALQDIFNSTAQFFLYLALRHIFWTQEFKHQWEHN